VRRWRELVRVHHTQAKIYAFSTDNTLHALSGEIALNKMEQERELGSYVTTQTQHAQSSGTSYSEKHYCPSDEGAVNGTGTRWNCDTTSTNYRADIQHFPIPEHHSRSKEVAHETNMKLRHTIAKRNAGIERMQRLRLVRNKISKPLVRQTSAGGCRGEASHTTAW
jgi:hypothetical protein